MSDWDLLRGLNISPVTNKLITDISNCVDVLDIPINNDISRLIYINNNTYIILNQLINFSDDMYIDDKLREINRQTKLQLMNYREIPILRLQYKK